MSNLDDYVADLVPDGCRIDALCVEVAQKCFEAPLVAVARICLGVLLKLGIVLVHAGHVCVCVCVCVCVFAYVKNTL